MTFLHVSLIAGMAAITVPVMLHLFGQRQPKVLDFPALRFVRETRQAQSSSWQLRHMLLLLLRILLLAVLVLALTQPRVHSNVMSSVVGLAGVGVLALLATLISLVGLVTKRSRLAWGGAGLIAVALWLVMALWAGSLFWGGPKVPKIDRSAPVAVALVIDNGPSMSYRSENQTRLDAAKEMAEWILDQLPPDSQVGVLGGTPIGSLSLDPTAAKSLVDSLETRGGHVDLGGRLQTAMELVEKNDLERKEVYVLTDMSVSSWQQTGEGLQTLLTKLQDEVLVQLVDVGQEEQINWRLGDLKADADVVPVGSEVRFEIDVEYRSDSGQIESQPLTIELQQQSQEDTPPRIVDGKLKTPRWQAVDRKLVELTPGGEDVVSGMATVELVAPGLEAGSHNFRVRIDKSDPLDIDNERYFSIVAVSQQPTLVMANDLEIGRVMSLIADPTSSVTEDGEPTVAQVSSNQLSSVAIDEYSLFWLHDPPPLNEDVLKALADKVRSGAGLLITMGSAFSDREVDVAPWADLLPGAPERIEAKQRSQRDGFFVQKAVTHPLFNELATIAEDVPWNQYPIFRFWEFEELKENASVLAEMSDSSKPIILEHRLGSGRVITFTLPLPEVQRRGSGLWSELWAAGGPWAFSILNGSLGYLNGTSQASMTMPVGRNVVLDNDPANWPSRYELLPPDAVKRPIRAQDKRVSLGAFDQVGTYYLVGERLGPVVRSFSLNAAADDTSLQRFSPEEIESLLGQGSVRIAADRAEIESSVGAARYGKELFPLLMVFVALLFLGEQAMSNRFYEIRLRARVEAGP